MTLATAASMTLAQGRTLMSQLMQDESTIAPFWSAATKTTCLQEWYKRWHAHFYNRLDRMAGTATFGAIASSTKSIISVDATVKVWRHVHRETSSSAVITGPELEQKSPHRVRALQVSDPTPGPPTVVGLDRRGAATNSDAVGFWQVELWPIPDATYYISALAMKNPYYPVADGDFFDCSMAEALIVIALAAIQGAIISGLDDSWIEYLWRFVPPEIQAVMRTEMLSTVSQPKYEAGAQPT